MKKKPPLHKKHYVFTTNTNGLILFTETINVYCGNYNYLSTYLLTYSVEQSPSSEANRFSANQEIPRITWNPTVHYRFIRARYLSLC